MAADEPYLLGSLVGWTDGVAWNSKQRSVWLLGAYFLRLGCFGKISSHRVVAGLGVFKSCLMLPVERMKPRAP